MDLMPSLDAQAILLLCARLGDRQDDTVKPLTTRQYSALAKWLRERSLRPGDLLNDSGRSQLDDLNVQELNAGSVEKLLARGAALAIMVERWVSRGMWILSRGDAAYPTRYRNYLQHNAPPLLYGVGSQAVIQDGGLAVVGSRNAGDEDIDFARRIGASCASQHVCVISGAAKGVDSESMMSSIDRGGRAIGVLAEGLSRASIASSYRQAIVDEQLTLMSPFDPELRWLSFNAMERNKLIYGLADAALIVACADEKSGTWAGAVDALKLGRIPVYVKQTGTFANGNKKLSQMGARDFPVEAWNDVSGLFRRPAQFTPLFEQSEASGTHQQEPAVPATEGALITEQAQTSSACEHVEDDAYSHVWPLLLKVLEQPQEEQGIAKSLNVLPGQARAWLKRAVAEGTVKKLAKPVRYVRASESLFIASTTKQRA